MCLCKDLSFVGKPSKGVLKAFEAVCCVFKDEELHGIHMEEDEGTTYMGNAASKRFAHHTLPCRPISFVQPLIIKTSKSLTSSTHKVLSGEI